MSDNRPMLHLPIENESREKIGKVRVFEDATADVFFIAGAPDVMLNEALKGGRKLTLVLHIEEN